MRARGRGGLGFVWWFSEYGAGLRRCLEVRRCAKKKFVGVGLALGSMTTVMGITGCDAAFSGVMTKSELERRILEENKEKEVRQRERRSVVAKWVLKILGGLGDIWRALQLVAIFSPCAVTWPFWYFFPEWKARPNWWLDLVVQCMQRAGPSYIKLGQWASTRADLFNSQLRKALRVLHDDVGLESMKLTVRTLKDAHVMHLLEDFGEQPIGAGCIAQVHKAKLRSSGEWVVLKIQRRNVRRQIERDISLMRVGVRFFNFVLPRSMSEMLGLRESSELFAEFMTVQMDFNQEALNLLRFRENFKDSKLNVTFPKPCFVSQCGKILMESFEEGETLSRLLDSPTSMKDPKERRAIGAIGVQSFLKMVLLDNFCHSDLHPGNILVQRLAKGGNHKVVFLDAGLTTTLSEEDRVNFVDLFAAVATGNGELAGQLMVDRADPQRMKFCKDPEGFVKGIAQVVSKVKVNSFRLDKVQIGSVLEQVLSLVQTYQVPIDPAFTNLILSIIVLEGIGRTLDPTLDIFKESLPILWKLDKKFKIVALRKVIH